MWEFNLSIGDTICLGNDISITFLERHNNYARLGITAPKDVSILRSGSVKYEEWKYKQWAESASK